VLTSNPIIRGCHIPGEGNNTGVNKVPELASANADVIKEFFGRLTYRSGIGGSDDIGGTTILTLLLFFMLFGSVVSSRTSSFLFELVGLTGLKDIDISKITFLRMSHERHVENPDGGAGMGSQNDGSSCPTR
jgi:hypothetical protein